MPGGVGGVASRDVPLSRSTDLTDRPVRFWIALRRYAVVYEAGPPVTIVHVRDWRRDPSTLID